MAKIIAISNFKGGVAKTATAINLCAALSNYGKRCLLIDLDTQCSASKQLDFHVGDGETVYDCLVDEDMKTILPIYGYNDTFDFVPASKQLRLAPEVLNPRLRKEDILKYHIGNVSADYDYVVIDCPPGDGILNLNALSASDYVIAPTTGDRKSIDGLTDMMARMEQVKRLVNPNISLLSILFTIFDGRTNLHKKAYEQICGEFPNIVSDIKIPMLNEMRKADEAHKTIFEYSRWCMCAIKYDSFAKEILGRIA